MLPALVLLSASTSVGDVLQLFCYSEEGLCLLPTFTKLDKTKVNSFSSYLHTNVTIAAILVMDHMSSNVAINLTGVSQNTNIFVAGYGFGSTSVESLENNFKFYENSPIQILKQASSEISSQVPAGLLDQSTKRVNFAGSNSGRSLVFTSIHCKLNLEGDAKSRFFVGVATYFLKMPVTIDAGYVVLDVDTFKNTTGNFSAIQHLYVFSSSKLESIIFGPTYWKLTAVANTATALSTVVYVNYSEVSKTFSFISPAVNVSLQLASGAKAVKGINISLFTYTYDIYMSLTGEQSTQSTSTVSFDGDWSGATVDGGVNVASSNSSAVTVENTPSGVAVTQNADAPADTYSNSSSTASNSLPGWGIALIVIGAVAVVGVAGFVGFKAFKSRRTDAELNA